MNEKIDEIGEKAAEVYINSLRYFVYAQCATTGATVWL